jgi:hypothetical protein
MRPAVTTGVSKVRVHISVSADGYVAGPNQSLENPLGEGGEALHEWVVALRAWREPHGMEGGEVNASTPVVEEMTANVGAEIMGRGKFGGGPCRPAGARRRRSALRRRRPELRLEQVRAIEAPGVTHLQYRVVS